MTLSKKKQTHVKKAYPEWLHEPASVIDGRRELHAPERGAGRVRVEPLNRRSAGVQQMMGGQVNGEMGAMQRAVQQIPFVVKKPQLRKGS